MVGRFSFSTVYTYGKKTKGSQPLCGFEDLIISEQQFKILAKILVIHENLFRVPVTKGSLDNKRCFVYAYLGLRN